MMCLQVLRCWLLLPCLSLGVSLRQVSPDLHFWSDTSAVGWGAHLDCQVASGLWDPPTDSVVYQRRGIARYSAGAFPVLVSSPRSHSGCLLRQHHSGDFPLQGGWHLVSSPQHLGSGDLALEGVPPHPPGSTVPSGLRQCPSRRPVSPSPAPTSRVVSTHDRLSVFGTAFRLTRSIRWLSFRVFSQSSGPPRGRNSLLWLPTGLSALGFRT